MQTILIVQNYYYIYISDKHFLSITIIFRKQIGIVLGMQKSEHIKYCMRVKKYSNNIHPAIRDSPIVVCLTLERVRQFLRRFFYFQSFSHEIHSKETFKYYVSIYARERSIICRNLLRGIRAMLAFHFAITVFKITCIKNYCDYVEGIVM